LSSEESLIEKKTKILIKLRGYKIAKKEEVKNAHSYTLKMKDGKKAILWAVTTQGTVGVAYVNQLKKQMDEAEIGKGIVVTIGKYTHTAKKRSIEYGIELIPKIFPSFQIFDHDFVSKHELLDLKEKEKFLEENKFKAYQLPRINAFDPAIIAVGGVPGDIVRVIRNSKTAGRYVSYRYVV
jgi:DNA-directed RNA polymerase subunit H (RpoH/RPB5)